MRGSWEWLTEPFDGASGPAAIDHFGSISVRIPGMSRTPSLIWEMRHKSNNVLKCQAQTQDQQWRRELQFCK